MQITLNWQMIIGLAGGIAAIAALAGYYNRFYDFVKRQKEQDKDIKAIKKENSLIVESIRACLDGLEQLGANHTVPAAKQKIDTYLNEQAHGLN